MTSACDRRETGKRGETRRLRSVYHCERVFFWGGWVYDEVGMVRVGGGFLIIFSYFLWIFFGYRGVL